MAAANGLGCHAACGAAGTPAGGASQVLSAKMPINMNYHIPHKKEHFCVSVRWTRHRLWQEGKVNPHPEEHRIYLYMIVGRFNASRRILYIGKTYRQYASYRLTQPDHIRRRKKLRREYPHHKLTVSFGIVNFDGVRCTSKRIDEVESILIYANWHPEIFNSKKVYHMAIREQIRVTNRGYYKPLTKECYYGTVVR